ncbi:2',3'-cyclic-nucleotide 3'-phosphodiesterase [Acididesulfobacillus acetoxydans]|uniref:RNA 2',3'-cyclic phosphodiesterase n=1 Tax=Acididesulfobacillus acetoxydans TaxID=1561005 RepID=A0A8S0X6E8_9FIRM|nr:RNA 2',3'-cyclic phosphodiesterase [Acididesulfobacillus acetoxydans]CAA7602470.1 2',3'-cyclic-nucleotide 3'-phosphodiesterase [Acididesulfobacillus acetoxydans]CEJ05925.1 2'-5' RNA ligase [Acididesulfobacillus acetoxydans]
MRVFVAINWSQETLSELLTWQRILRNEGVEGYWRAGDNLHLTLKFLGEVSPQAVAGIGQALAVTAESGVPFTVRLGGFGVFPNLQRPRILWAGVQSTGLVQLQRRLDRALAQQGYPPEGRPYRPHITLASGGIRGFDAQRVRDVPIRTDEVRGFALMESVVERGRRKYVPLGEYLLTAKRERN